MLSKVEKLAEEAGVQLQDLSPLEEEKFKKNNFNKNNKFCLELAKQY